MRSWGVWGFAFFFEWVLKGLGVFLSFLVDWTLGMVSWGIGWRSSSMVM